eukprot:Pgem_evm1s7043
MTVEEVQALDEKGYDPTVFYENNSTLRKVLDQINSGVFCPESPSVFHPIVDSLLVH